MNKIIFPPKIDFKIGRGEYINRKYHEFYNKYGYLPKYFEPYHTRELKELSPTILTESGGSATKAGSILIITTQ